MTSEGFCRGQGVCRKKIPGLTQAAPRSTVLRQAFLRGHMVLSIIYLVVAIGVSAVAALMLTRRAGELT